MKKHVVIIFGGKSGEHAVSVRSAKSIEQFLDKDKYTSSYIGITETGLWHHGRSVAEITDGTKVIAPSSHQSLPSQTADNTLTLTTNSQLENVQCDIVFPVIHGTNGEDGRLQGLMEMANLPYVGSDVLGSAVAMDKVVQKTLCAYHHIPQAKFVSITKTEWLNNQSSILTEINAKLSLPVFTKPVNLGSSVGISKVKNSADLAKAIDSAFEFDTKVIVEEGINDMVEIEVSVLGNEQPQASVCGSIKPNSEFYDYDTKYVTDDIERKIPADIPPHVADEIRATAIQAFKVLNCSGLARIDFFYQPTTGQHFLNEVNTLPGFTSISMYPQLWEASGVSYPELITKLLELAEEKWQSKQTLKYIY